ncbi:hypothetical protein [Algisphaera agarilytica]|uniref:Uncharacterized protein n=1 Tax=Algisphaera agarilytica TaxID=1385975 RepID=A0A7X0H8X6_9BACT|nr:hypothetical protein [Algisphaera agarilytica]MBB6431464.1 hypothetical protein [Algisphaera agarilytica]
MDIASTLNNKRPSGWLTQFAVGIMCSLSMMPPIFLVGGASIYNEGFRIINSGTIGERLMLPLVILILGNFISRIARAVFYKLEWRKPPQTKISRFLEKKFWSKLFYSARTDTSEYITLELAARRIWLNKTAIDPSDLSWSERAAIRLSLVDDGAADGLSQNEFNVEYSRSLAAACFLSCSLCIIAANIYGTWLISILLFTLYAVFLRMHLRMSSNAAEECAFDEQSKLAKFVFENSTAHSTSPDSAKSQELSREHQEEILT